MTRRTPGKFSVSVARVTKLAGFSVLAASLIAMSAIGSLAQSAADSAKPSERKDTMYQQIKRGADVAIFPPLAAVAVPTTKILAIGNVTAKGTPDAIGPVLPFEVRATVRLHLAGKIDQWFFQNESYGVVFIMNCATVAEAHELLEKLPLGVAGMMEFELIPLGPLKPLASLLGEPPRP
jgi:hypothetical protein